MMNEDLTPRSPSGNASSSKHAPPSSNTRVEQRDDAWRACEGGCLFTPQRHAYEALFELIHISYTLPLQQAQQSRYKANLCTVRGSPHLHQPRQQHQEPLPSTPDSNRTPSIHPPPSPRP